MRIGLAADGRLTLYNGAVDIGQGSNTIMTQMAADALGVPVEAFRIVMGDTDRTADGGKTSASRQTFVSGNAVKAAGEDLRQKLLRLANVGAGATITLGDGQVMLSENGHAQAVDLARLPVLNDEGDVLLGEGRFDPARASPMPPMASPLRWRRWRSMSSWAPSRSVESLPLMTWGAPSIRSRSRGRSTAASPRAWASLSWRNICPAGARICTII
jgi:hypothetical protein